MKKISVPLLKQTKMACGPTCLAMVLKYFKNEIPLPKIIKGVGGIKSYGVRSIALSEYAKKLGYKTYCFSYNEKLSKGKAEIKKPNINQILKFLKKRLPVIIGVISNLSSDSKHKNSGHFIVITKYQNNTFWYNNPSNAKEFKIKENDLLFSWYNNVLDSSAYLLVLEPKK